MSPKDRLKLFIDSIGLKPAAFERECGLGNGFVSKIGDSIRKEKLDLISKRFPELNIDWVINEKGSMLSDSGKEMVMEPRHMYDANSTASEQFHDPGQEQNDYIPLLPIEAMAGSLQGISQGIELRDCRKIKSPVRGADWAIQISGDSMEPDYKNGTILFIKKLSGGFTPWGHPLVIDTIDGVVFKIIVETDDYGQSIEARSINPKYPPFRIETSCILGTYRVLGGTFINSTI